MNCILRALKWVPLCPGLTPFHDYYAIYLGHILRQVEWEVLETMTFPSTLVCLYISLRKYSSWFLQECWFEPWFTLCAWHGILVPYSPHCFFHSERKGEGWGQDKGWSKLSSPSGFLLNCFHYWELQSSCVIMTSCAHRELLWRFIFEPTVSVMSFISRSHLIQSGWVEGMKCDVDSRSKS